MRRVSQVGIFRVCKDPNYIFLSGVSYFKTIALWGRYLVNGCFFTFKVVGIFCNRDGPVDVVTRLGTGRPQIGVRFLTGARNFLVCVQTSSAVPQPRVQWVPAALAVLVELPEREDDHWHVMVSLTL